MLSQNNDPVSKIVLPLNSKEVDLETVGGKGFNLVKLANAGYPVPGGYLISTRAYLAYVSENGLEERIRAAIPHLATGESAVLESASQTIRSQFTQGRLSDDLTRAIIGAYRAIGSPPVAVRSSATAEDLPDISFAGQQDTFLNVVGEDALLRAVVDCWSSLWTTRAIGYRIRNHIPNDHIALAVVVQEMVASEVSGVVFTANPVTGLRTEMVIDATFGLGEALVSGRVEPDHYVVDTIKMQITSKLLGAKAVAIHGSDGGGTVLVHEDAGQRQALPDGQILALVELCQGVSRLYGIPQDIEWVWAKGKLYLLQSRAITSLYPLPRNMPAEPLRVMISFGAVQGMLDPLTTLGQDSLCMLIAGIPQMFGVYLTHETQQVAWRAGERLWIDLTGVVRNTIGRPVAHGALKFVEPGIVQNLDTIWDDPRLVPQKKRGIRLKTLYRLARFALPTLYRMMRNWLTPEARNTRMRQQSETYLAAFQEKFTTVSQIGDPTVRLRQRVELMHDMLLNSGPMMFRTLVPLLSAGMAHFTLLRKMASELPLDNSADLGMEVSRGVPDNVTTEMDLELWNIAKIIRADPEASARSQDSGAVELAADYLAGRLPKAPQAAVEAFLARYGMRGVGEIDLGRSRWLENPIQVFQPLKSYLHIEDKTQTPEAIFAQSVQVAKKAVVQIGMAARRSRNGWWKAHLVRLLAGRARVLLGARESPKFFIARMMGIFRQGLLRSGSDLVETGLLAAPDDIFHLEFSELQELAQGTLGWRSPGEWRSLIAGRRAAYQREKQRRQIPRLLLSDGRAFFEGISTPLSDQSTSLMGSPVSPGTVEGVVHVILDPGGAYLAPGEILVCPGTDPAWTPLFLTAGGLVMEVGGMMTHGAVVAREYGIPAVVGVHQATTRLVDGQRIRVNGSTGLIEIVEN